MKRRIRRLGMDGMPSRAGVCSSSLAFQTISVNGMSPFLEPFQLILDLLRPRYETPNQADESGLNGHSSLFPLDTSSSPPHHSLPLRLTCPDPSTTGYQPPACGLPTSYPRLGCSSYLRFRACCQEPSIHIIGIKRHLGIDILKIGRL